MAAPNVPRNFDPSLDRLTKTAFQTLHRNLNMYAEVNIMLATTEHTMTSDIEDRLIDLADEIAADFASVRRSLTAMLCEKQLRIFHQQELIMTDAGDEAYVELDEMQGDLAEDMKRLRKLTVAYMNIGRITMSP